MRETQMTAISQAAATCTAVLIASGATGALSVVGAEW